MSRRSRIWIALSILAVVMVAAITEWIQHPDDRPPDDPSGRSDRSIEPVLRDRAPDPGVFAPGPPPGERTSAGVSLDFEANRLLSAAAVSLPDETELRVVVDVVAVGVRHVRVRPFVAGVELRGADLRLRETADGWSLRSDVLPRAGDVTPLVDALRSALQLESSLVPGPLDGSDPAAGDLLHELVRQLSLDSITRDAETRLSFYLARDTGPSRASRSQTSGAGGTDRIAWGLRAELGLLLPPLSERTRQERNALAAAWRALPWNGSAGGAAREREGKDGTDAGMAPPQGTLWLDLALHASPDGLVTSGVRDARLHAGTGRALVFDPDPVSSSGDPSLRDGDPVDTWRRWAELSRLDDGDGLSGRWIHVRSDRPPRALESSRVYAYLSADPRFEECMAYFHGDRALERLEDAVPGAFGDALAVRVHGTLADNSWYSRPHREVVLGDGGVDDAEDADIIVHEVAHAIHDALVPGFQGGDTHAISEGFADFWAASLHDDPCVGNWDATSYDPPCLRRSDSALFFPTDLTGSPHYDGRLYSGALWEIRERLGAETAETLALHGFLRQSTEATFPEAARSLLDAAAALGLSTEEQTHVREALARRGLARRIVEIDLAGEGGGHIALQQDASFLGHPVGGLALDMTGRVTFLEVPQAGDLEAFPGGPPALVAGGLAPSEIDALGDRLGLRVTVAIDADGVEFLHRWSLNGRPLLRTRVDWNPVTGRASWTYLDVGAPPPGGWDLLGAGFFAGLHGPPSEAPDLAPVDWESLPARARSQTGFHGPLGDRLSLLVGARFSAQLHTEAPEGAESAEIELFRSGAPITASASGMPLAAQPNPFGQRTEVRLRLEHPGELELDLFDASGRLVRSATEPAGETGLLEWSWDGRDQAGRPLPSGRYWLRARASGREGTLSLIKLR